MKLESVILLVCMCVIMTGCSGYIPPVIYQLDDGMINVVVGIRG